MGNVLFASSLHQSTHSFLILVYLDLQNFLFSIWYSLDNVFSWGSMDFFLVQETTQSDNCTVFLPPVMTRLLWRLKAEQKLPFISMVLFLAPGYSFLITIYAQPCWCLSGLLRIRVISFHSTFLFQQAWSAGPHPLTMVGIANPLSFFMNSIHIFGCISPHLMLSTQKLRYNLYIRDPKRTFPILEASKCYPWRICLLLVHLVGTVHSIWLEGLCYCLE